MTSDSLGALVATPAAPSVSSLPFGLSWETLRLAPIQDDPVGDKDSSLPIATPLAPQSSATAAAAAATQDLYLVSLSVIFPTDAVPPSVFEEPKSTKAASSSAAMTNGRQTLRFAPLFLLVRGAGFVAVTRKERLREMQTTATSSSPKANHPFFWDNYGAPSASATLFSDASSPEWVSAKWPAGWHIPYGDDGAAAQPFSLMVDIIVHRPFLGGIQIATVNIPITDPTIREYRVGLPHGGGTVIATFRPRGNPCSSQLVCSPKVTISTSPSATGGLAKPFPDTMSSVRLSQELIALSSSSSSSSGGGAGFTSIANAFTGTPQTYEKPFGNKKNDVATQSKPKKRFFPLLRQLLFPLPKIAQPKMK